MKQQNSKNKILNMKGNNGITLVALIITIIVLLILAVVAISAVNNTGIIQHAQNSADEYTDKRDKENIMVGNYLDIINHYKPKQDKNEEILERIYYVVNETWAEGYATSEEEVPENATITAKFYKTSTLCNPVIPGHWKGDGIDIPLDEGNAYKLVIDGKGNMPKVIDMDNEVGSAWRNEMQEDPILYYLTEVEINGVSNVPVCALYVTCAVNKCYLDSSVKTIDQMAFMESVNLENINLENVENISLYAFANNKKISSVNLPNIIEIGVGAFVGNENLTELKIGNKIETIGDDAFCDCTNLTNITIQKAPGSLDLTNSGLTEAQIANIVWAPETE